VPGALADIIQTGMNDLHCPHPDVRCNLLTSIGREFPTVLRGTQLRVAFPGFFNQSPRGEVDRLRASRPAFVFIRDGVRLRRLPDVVLGPEIL